MEPAELGRSGALARAEKRRRRPARIADERLNLAHGAGGKASAALIEALFVAELGNPALDELGDSALVALTAAGPEGESGRVAVTTDAFVVNPLFFPGGDIGELAVNGTVNDLAMAGARPVALCASFICEEGLAVADLRRIAASAGRAAERAGVPVVAGDTKVVERAKGDGVYVTTTGIGIVPAGLDLSPRMIRPGDRLLLSGTIGDHGMAVMAARGDLDLEVDLESDTAPLHELAAGISAAAPGLRCMRDPTRGGVATVCNELALAAEVAITLDEQALPLRPAVMGACEVLGIDPLYVANEGKLVAIVAPQDADAALAAARAHPLGAEAALAGEVRAEPPGMVLLETAFGGTRVVDTLVGNPLPRIC